MVVNAIIFLSIWYHHRHIHFISIFFLFYSRIVTDMASGSPFKLIILLIWPHYSFPVSLLLHNKMFQLHPFNISLVIKFSFNPFSSLYYPRNVKQRSKYVTVSWCLDFSLAFSKSKSQVNDCSIGKSFRNWSQEAKMKGLGNWDLKGKKVNGMCVSDLASTVGSILNLTGACLVERNIHFLRTVHWGKGSWVINFIFSLIEEH